MQNRKAILTTEPAPHLAIYPGLFCGHFTLGRASIYLDTSKEEFDTESDSKT